MIPYYLGCEIRKQLFYCGSTGVFLSQRTGQVVMGVAPEGYLKVTVFGKGYKAHRLAWFFYHGHMPNTKTFIDHKNHIKFDNRMQNLRLATAGQNNAHRTEVEGKVGDQRDAARAFLKKLRATGIVDYKVWSWKDDAERA